METPDHGHGPGDDLVGDVVDDRRGDRIAVARRREHDRRQAFAELLMAEPPELQVRGQVAGRFRPNAAGTSRSRLVRGPRPSRPRIAAASASIAMPPPAPRSPEWSPTAANRTTRPVGPIPRPFVPAPHTTTTPHGRSLPARSARMGVVEDDDLVGQAATMEIALEHPDVARQVGAGQGVDPEGRHRAALQIEPGLPERRGDARLQVVEPRLQADRLVRDGRTADGGEH